MAICIEQKKYRPFCALPDIQIIVASRTVATAATGQTHSDNHNKTVHESPGLVDAIGPVGTLGRIVFFRRHSRKGTDALHDCVHQAQSGCGNALGGCCVATSATARNPEGLACLVCHGHLEQRDPVFLDCLGPVSHRIGPCLDLQRHDATVYRTGGGITAGG